MVGTALLRFGRPIVLLVGLAVPARLPAAGALQQPYHLHIVLHVAPHRLLTPVFRDRVERELRDTLQAALGDLGQVELSRKHPMLERVLERGLQHGLDSWKTRADVKTHFVLIDFNGSEYEVQARQHDGTTGLLSPCVRRDRTRDRDLVAKTAALLIALDFGLLGTVVEPPNAQHQAKVELRGGGLAPLSSWVRKGDVFALAPLGGTGQALPFALLQVLEGPREEARDGLCTCRFFHRYRIERSLAGWLCIKLGTVRAPLRLRWMRQEAGGKLAPLNGDLSLTVAIRHYGFSGEEKTLLTQTAREDGVIDTSREERGLFENVAFVSVTGGSIPEQQRPQVPVALVNNEPVIVPVSVNAQADNVLPLRVLAWQRAVADSLLVQIVLFQEIKALSAKPEKRSEVLARAEEGLKRSQTDYETLTSVKATLQKEAAESRTPLNLGKEEKRLRDLKEGEKLLEDFVQKQRKIEAEENNPKIKALRAEVEEGRLLEKDLEIDRALAVYKKVLEEGFNDPSLQKYYDDLKNRWKPVDEQHSKARVFVYRTWPHFEAARLKEQLPEARQAFLECKRANDVITIRKLFKGCEAHAIQLTQERAQLHPDLHTEDEQPAKRLDEISEQLIKLAEDIDAYLKEKG